MKLADILYNAMSDVELFGQPVKLVDLPSRNGTAPRVSNIRDTVRKIGKKHFDDKSFFVYFSEGELFIDIVHMVSLSTAEPVLRVGSLISIVHDKMTLMVNNGVKSLDVTDLNGKITYETLRVYVSRLNGDFFQDVKFGTSKSGNSVFIVIK